MRREVYFPGKSMPGVTDVRSHIELSDLQRQFHGLIAGDAQIGRVEIDGHLDVLRRGDYVLYDDDDVPAGIERRWTGL